MSEEAYNPNYIATEEEFKAAMIQIPAITAALNSETDKYVRLVLRYKRGEHIFNIFSHLYNLPYNDCLGLADCISYYIGIQQGKKNKEYKQTIEDLEKLL